MSALTLFMNRFFRAIALCVSLLMVVPTCLAFEVRTYVPDGELVGSFLGPNGWKGHITANAKGIKVLVWEAPDGLVVVGKLLDANARDLTRLAQQKYQTNEIAVSVLSKLSVASDHLAVADDGRDVEAVVYAELESLEASHYTSQQSAEGESLKPLYVFYDYECPYCASAYAFFEAARLPIEVRWLPVSILSSASAQFGAGALEGSAPLAHIANTKVLAHPQPEKASLERVAHNTALLKSMQKRASTPTFVFATKDEGVMSVSGFSDATKTLLATQFSD